MQGMSGNQNCELASTQCTKGRIEERPWFCPTTSRHSQPCSLIRFSWDFLRPCFRRDFQDLFLRCTGNEKRRVMPLAERSASPPSCPVPPCPDYDPTMGCPGFLIRQGYCVFHLHALHKKGFTKIKGDGPLASSDYEHQTVTNL